MKVERKEKVNFRSKSISEEVMTKSSSIWKNSDSSWQQLPAISLSQEPQVAEAKREVSANFPPQKCLLTVTPTVAVIKSINNDMESAFFISEHKCNDKIILMLHPAIV